MLYVMTLLVSFSVFAELEPMSLRMRECMTNVFDRAGFDKSKQHQLLVGQGDRAFDKRVRAFVEQAKPAVYEKHTKARNPAEAAEMSKKHAQYMPGVVRERLERRALRMDTPGVLRENQGTLFKFVRFESPVGYDLGKPTYFMRVEIGPSGEFHGHPMSPSRVRDSIGDADFKALSE